MTEDEVNAVAEKVTEKLRPIVEEYHEKTGSRYSTTNTLVRNLIRMVEEQNDRQAKMARALSAIVAPESPAGDADGNA